MPDPTESVIIATFSSAFGLFAVAAVARKWTTRDQAVREEITGYPEPAGHSPYDTPAAEAVPPPLPTGNVPTRFYQPLDLLGIGFIFAVFFGLVVASVRTAAQEEVTLDPLALLVSIGFQFIIAAIVTSFVLTRVTPVEWLGLKWRAWPWVFLVAPAAVVVMWAFFAGLQASGYMEWMESLGVEAVQDTVKLLQESSDPVVLALMAFAAVIAAPFCEEIVFRGYLYPATKRFTGPWAATVCSALVFAAAHGSLAALLPLFVFGCLLVLLYEKTGSIWAPIAVHLCFNGATVLVQMAVRYYKIPIEPVP